MRRLWNAPGVMTAALLAAILLTHSARQDGIASMGFLWSAVICAVVAALALPFRYWSERHSESNGQHPNHHIAIAILLMAHLNSGLPPCLSRPDSTRASIAAMHPVWSLKPIPMARVVAIPLPVPLRQVAICRS
jgi:hypothetical protein